MLINEKELKNIMDKLQFIGNLMVKDLVAKNDLDVRIKDIYPDIFNDLSQSVKLIDIINKHARVKYVSSETNVYGIDCAKIEIIFDTPNQFFLELDPNFRKLFYSFLLNWAISMNPDTIKIDKITKRRIKHIELEEKWNKINEIHVNSNDKGILRRWDWRKMMKQNQKRKTEKYV